jgi:hypothetical protein
MPNARPHACLRRLIAVYIVIYSVITQMPWWDEWWRGIVSLSTPGPSAITEAGATAQKIILLAWLPLSTFVWLGQEWARWALSYTAAALAIAQLASYERMFMEYGYISIVSEAVVLVVPTLFLSALAFCPLLGESFQSKASNQSMEPTASPRTS